MGKVLHDTPSCHYMTNDMIPQLFVAPKANNWLAWPLQFVNTKRFLFTDCTHLLLSAERMVQPVVNTPVVGSPHLLQRMFHACFLHHFNLSLESK
jgi:hypothetical protein